MTSRRRRRRRRSPRRGSGPAPLLVPACPVVVQARVQAAAVACISTRCLLLSWSLFLYPKMTIPLILHASKLFCFILVSYAVFFSDFSDSLGS